MSISFSPEQKKLRQTIIEFARQELNPGVSERDHAGEFPRDLWKKCADMRIMALPFPEEYGGDGFDFETTIAIFHALGYACKDSGLVHSIMTQVLCGYQILQFGSEQQKTTLLPVLAEGENIFAQAITESASGSNALELKSIASKNGDGYLINGAKTMISNGPIADQIIVFVTTNPQRKALGGISSFIIPGETEGLSVGKPLDKLGLRTLVNGEIFFDGCKVGKEALLGGEGQGAIIFQESMEWERILIPACLLGELERVWEASVAFAKERSSFGQSLMNYQAISHKIAAMRMNIELGKLSLYHSAGLKNEGRRATLETSITKLFISESLKQACLDALQIHGGYGYTTEYEIERDLRDSLASTIYSGTSEIQYNIIARLKG